jgi:hypothetical protein
MLSLHWHVYSFLECIFNLFAKFAIDFGNVNVMTGSRPLAELNTKLLVKGLTVMKAFEDQLTLAQSTNSPIPILAATVSKFITRSPFTNSNVGTPAPTHISTSALPDNTHQNQRCNVKGDPSTPDKSTKAAATQHQKKPRRNGATDPAKQRPVADMGMFFLTKYVTKATDIFPKDMPTKICADFTCKGCKCTRENCPHSHPRNACKLTVETIAAIVHHFSSKKIGWLNKWHFMISHLMSRLLWEAKIIHPPVRGPDICNTFLPVCIWRLCFAPHRDYCPDTVIDIHLALPGSALPSPPQVVQPTLLTRTSSEQGLSNKLHNFLVI